MDTQVARKIINAFVTLKNHAPKAADAAGKELYSSLYPFFVSDTADIMLTMKREFPFITGNNKIAAIKRYRELNPCGLMEAKTWVENHLPVVGRDE